MVERKYIAEFKEDRKKAQFKKCFKLSWIDGETWEFKKT